MSSGASRRRGERNATPANFVSEARQGTARSSFSARLPTSSPSRESPGSRPRDLRPSSQNQRASKLLRFRERRTETDIEVRLAIPNDLRREWKAYLRGRLWAFAIQLALLGALALIQYHWINQVAEAERQRAKADLAAALSNVESDFDIEITRAFAVFEAPAANLSEYSERYRQWLRFAPYPGLVRGVYILDERNTNEHPKIQIVSGPAIPPREWQENLARRAVPVSGATFAGSVGSEPGFQVFSQAGVVSSGPELNPA